MFVPAACTVSPTVRVHDSVSVQIYSGSDFYPDLEKGSLPARDDAPGETTVDVTSKLIQDCGSLVSGENAGLGAVLAPFCVLGGVAAGATAGAIAKGVDGEPKKANVSLQSAIEEANSTDTADTWRAMLQASLEEAGRQQGKTVVPFPDGESVYVVVQDLHWAREGSMRWAIAGKFRVATRYGDRFATKNFTISGKDYGIDDWLADDGRLVVDEMQRFFDQVAGRVWTIVTR